MKKNTTTAKCTLTVEMWAIDKPKDYPKNARTWTDAETDRKESGCGAVGKIDATSIKHKASNLFSTGIKNIEWNISLAFLHGNCLNYCYRATNSKAVPKR